MVSPVQLNGSQNVYFRSGEDLINSPGAFQQQAAPEIPADSVELSTKAEKKGSVGKTIAATVGSVLVLAGALWGLFKWKGNTWITKNPEGIMAKIKNWLAKPGEWLDKQGKNLVEKVRGTKKPEGEVKTEGTAPVTEAPAAAESEAAAVHE